MWSRWLGRAATELTTEKTTETGMLDSVLKRWFNHPAMREGVDGFSAKYISVSRLSLEKESGDREHTDPVFHLNPLEFCFVFTHTIMLYMCPIYYYILYVLSHNLS